MMPKCTNNDLPCKIGQISSPSMAIEALCNKSYREPYCMNSMTSIGTSFLSMTLPITCINEENQIKSKWASIFMVSVSILHKIVKKIETSVVYKNFLTVVIHGCLNLERILISTMN
jgi:hypothetical protein